MHWRGNDFFFEINFTALLSYAYPSDIVHNILKFFLQWITKICGPLKWSTARKRMRNTGPNVINANCRDGVV